MPTITKVNARGFTFEIFTKDATPVATAIGGINTWSGDNPATTTETTDFDSDGLSEGQVMERGFGITCEGFYLEDASKNRNTGQALVETACGEVGDDSLYTFRVTSPAGTRRTFSGHFALNEPGGGNNDKAGWGFTVTRSGATTVS